MSARNDPSRFAKMLPALATKPHGTRQRYIGGCKCLQCRAANSRYQTERCGAIRSGDWNGIVDAEAARAHLEYLSNRGVGLRAVSAAADVPRSILGGIRSGARKGIRSISAQRILAVTVEAAADRAYIPSRNPRALLDELIADGYSKRQLSRWLGSTAKEPKLQFASDRITARSAYKIARLYEGIRDGKYRRDK